MIIKNDYDRMIFNGDTGKVQRISLKDDEVEVRVFNWFDQESSVPRYVDKVFTFSVEECRMMLTVAYACTAHRCQGQEFDYVIMPMTMQYGIMLYRNLVYTAITRAKKKVFLFGDPDAFLFSVKNERETMRNSDLSLLISAGLDVDQASGFP
jgi:exodeoxyribonuclease V alpha subunit